jgi:histidine ammonia-lyase
MDNTHYISTELLSLEIVQEIISQHKSLELSEWGQNKYSKNAVIF